MITEISSAGTHAPHQGQCPQHPAHPAIHLPVTFRPHQEGPAWEGQPASITAVYPRLCVCMWMCMPGGTLTSVALININTVLPRTLITKSDTITHDVWWDMRIRRVKVQKMVHWGKDSLTGKAKAAYNKSKEKSGIHSLFPMGRQMFSHPQGSQAPSYVTVTESQNHGMVEVGRDL